MVELAGQPVPRETLHKLHQLSQLIIEESERQNLIASSTIDNLWKRHIVDAAQLVRFASSPIATWLDIGSGAGLPGLVVALLTEGRVSLAEPRRLRAEFLERAVAALSLGERVSVVQSKVEALRPAPFDVITARAVAPAGRLFAMAEHMTHYGTVWVLPKGKSAKSELDEAKRTWQGEFRLKASQTDPDARILIASRVRRAKRARGGP